MDRIWYAAYGSNVDRQRFLCYIEGGTPDGTSQAQRGCLDPTPPADDQPITLPYPLYFAKRSSRWGGGVAFVDPEPEAASTLGRMWLVTVGQFLEIAEQENGARRGTARLDLRALRRTGRTTVLDRGWYTTALWCNEHEGVGVATLTSSRRAAEEPRTQPSAAYLATIRRGLRDVHGLSDEDAERYLRARM